LNKKRKKSYHIKSLFNQNSFRQQFEAAYHKNFDKLYIYAKTITKSEEMAKDVVSEVFFNLWKMQPSFSAIKELDSYLFISVKNLSIRAISKDPKSFVSLDFENTLKTIEKINPEELLLEKELFHIIESVINTLPDQCRLVFHLVKDKQLKYREVAEELGIAEGTVKNHLIKALHLIREKVRTHLEDDHTSFDRYTKLGVAALLFTNIITAIELINS
jgi:RNA polymerase sigma-70 factor (ECF subfamily)